MLRALVISALALVTIATPILDITLDKHWEMWKDHENKKYNDKHEELQRRMIWEENFDMINLHNLEHSMEQHTYTMEMNSFGDLKHSEFVQRNGLKQSKKTMKLGNKFEHFQADPKVEVPDTMDWRDKGYVTPVKDQGQCGSCWSFSATGSLEGQYFAVYNTLKTFSEQQLVDCSTPEGDYGCNGGLMDDAFDYIEKIVLKQRPTTHMRLRMIHVELTHPRVLQRSQVTLMLQMVQRMPLRLLSEQSVQSQWPLMPVTSHSSFTNQVYTVNQLVAPHNLIMVFLLQAMALKMA